MKKIKVDLSDTVKRLIKLSFVIYGIAYIFYLLTKFGGFLLFAIGYCIGTAVNSALRYLEEYRKEKAYLEAEAKLNITMDQNNQENN